MSAAKKGKRTRKLVRIEVSRRAVVGWSLGLLLALLWMFLLGLFVGKGITPANINLAEVKKRMMAEGIWPGFEKTPQKEELSADTGAKENIPLKDLQFYEELAKKKKARRQNPTQPTIPLNKKPNIETEPRPGSPPRQATAKKRRVSSDRS